MLAEGARPDAVPGVQRLRAQEPHAVTGDEQVDLVTSLERRPGDQQPEGGARRVLRPGDDVDEQAGHVLLHPPRHDGSCRGSSGYDTAAMTDPTADLATPFRTHTAGQLRATDAGTAARLAGWVHRRRDHGPLIFLDLRDRHGITQVVVDAADAPDAHAIASQVRNEFVVSVGGEVVRRGPGTENARLPTGEIELRATDLEILSEAKTPPFYINEPDAPVDEGLRLKYRYLDIRRQPMADRLLLRSRMVQAIREVHHANGFVEVETPTLIKWTPEGARDFIVPSRLQPGSVYALPQSPQQLKQLLMVAGIDRYFQIARCYRDEDLRGDRQPEFTQLDLEMSFVDEAAVMGFVESMAIEVSRATRPDRPIQTDAVPAVHVRRGHGAIRFGQARYPLRDGARRPRAGTGGRRRTRVRVQRVR